MELKKDICETIFREYDLRGIYGSEINEQDAYTIGRSFGTYIKKFGETKTIIGHDNRHSWFRDAGGQNIDAGAAGAVHRH